MRQETTRNWATQIARPFGDVPFANLGLAVAAFAAVLVLLVVGVVAAVQVSYSGRMYPGVRALGVPLGGLTRDEARVILAGRIADMSNRTIGIGFKELTWTVAGHHLGVRPDVEPLLDEAYALGRQGNVFARVSAQFHLWANGADREVRATAYDPAALRAFMQALAGAVDRPVTDAQIALSPEGKVELVPGQPGRQLQVDATQRLLEEALAQPEVSFVNLAIRETEPNVSTDDLAAARTQAEALVSAPLVLKFGDDEWQLTPRQLSTMATLQGAAGVTLNRDAIRAWATQFSHEVEQQPQNARFSWQSGTLSLLRPSKDGRRLDVDRTVELVAAQALTADRTIALPVVVTRPDVSQDDAGKLKIDGAIEVARTSFAGSSPPKQHNITLATQRLNGVVVPPGKMFSFNKEVGSTSLDAGYKLGWGIANAGANVKTVPSVAGGICQVATTLFHTVFWAGYQVEERNYHLYWIPGYTSRGVEGLDATVDEEAGLDFRFINNTDNYLLIQSWTEGGRVVFGLYGTKPDWTVKVTPGQRAEVKEASTEQVVEEEPTLPAGQRLAVEGAMDGFKVTTVRTVTRGTEEPRILRLTSLYRPSRNVVLVGTGGRPAGPSQVVPNRPTQSVPESAPARPAPTAAPSTAAPKPTAAPAQPTAAPKPTAAPAQPTAAPKPATKPAVKPTAAPKPIIQPGIGTTGSPARTSTSQDGGR
ncbi:MAG: VanW family protein [Chloroflexi bacterium]|nr:VanW family protein [Chloroflexota bacterium]